MKTKALFLILCIVLSSVPGLAASSHQGMWVWNKEDIISNQDVLIDRAAKSKVTDLYLGVYDPTNPLLMVDPSALSNLIVKAHAIGIKVWAEYGNTDYGDLITKYGCIDSDGNFPYHRFKDVASYNLEHSNSKFDGLMLDVEPQPLDDNNLGRLLSLFACTHKILDSSGVKVGAAISAYWSNSQTQQIIDTPLNQVIVMSYLNTFGTEACPIIKKGDDLGVYCLVKAAVDYAGSKHKPDLILVGLETQPPGPGVEIYNTFNDMGQGKLNELALNIINKLEDSPGFGGFAIDAFKNSYLGEDIGGTTKWPNTNPNWPGIDIVPDTTPPASSTSLSPEIPNGLNGWYQSDVTVTLNATDDSGSATVHSSLDGGAESQATDSIEVILSSEGTHTITYYATDGNGNQETQSHSLTVKLDKTDPLVAFNPPTTAPNPKGWYHSDVTISYTASDAVSGIASVLPASPLILTDEGASISRTVIVNDTAGRSAPYTTTPVKIDKTSPAISASATSGGNAYTSGNWTSQDVTVTFGCLDRGSGVASQTAPVTVSADGGNQSVVGTCTDNADNTISITFTGINIDKTGPTLTFGAPNPAPNANGWNNTNVTFLYAAGDALSGISSVIPSNELDLNVEGSAVSDSVTVTDRAGNSVSFASPSVKIDKTPPTIQLTASQPSYFLDETYNVTCQTTDTGSGVPNGACPNINGSAAALGLGPHDLSSTVSDLAGNSSSDSVTITVIPRPGDLNADGNMDILDLMRFLRILIGLDVATSTDLAAGDMLPRPGTDGRAYGDGLLGATDLNWVLRRSVGLETAP